MASLEGWVLWAASWLLSGSTGSRRAFRLPERTALGFVEAQQRLPTSYKG